MAGSASKNKGKSWERDFAKFLTTQYGASFIRVPASGAYVGGKNATRKQFLDEGQIRSTKGDIIPPKEWRHFNVECKNYASFPFHQLTQGKVLQLETWIKQLLDAADPGDFNFIAFKITRQGIFITVPQLPEINPGTNYFSYTSEKYGNWYLMDYDKFWTLNTDAVKQLSLAK